LGLSHLLGVEKYVVYNEFKRISKVGHFTQSNFHDIDLSSHNLKLIRVLVQKRWITLFNCFLLIESPNPPLSLDGMHQTNDGVVGFLTCLKLLASS
jgi:hypothetical protein